jgi:serine phosphatase RsbU (regulator of sigma subunit)
MVLGSFEDAVDSDAAVETILEAGDRILIYTDGLIENFNSRREMLGVKGLGEIVLDASSLPLAEMKQQILNRVANWRSGPASDDVSVVLVEVH